MSNASGRKKDGDLTTLVATAMGVLDTPLGQSAYGVTPAMVSAMSDAAADLADGMASYTAAVAAEKAATQQKASAKAATVAALNAIAGVVYHWEGVTPQMLAAIGFAPPKNLVPRPAVAAPVAGLAATPVPDGSVRLAWERGSGTNPYGTMFLIESADASGVWTILGSTLRTTTTVEGYAPGVTSWFRITASTSASTARPSAAVAIYGPAAPAAVELKVA